MISYWLLNCFPLIISTEDNNNLSWLLCVPPTPSLSVCFSLCLSPFAYVSACYSSLPSLLASPIPSVPYVRRRPLIQPHPFYPIQSYVGLRWQLSIIYSLANYPGSRCVSYFTTNIAAHHKYLGSWPIERGLRMPRDTIRSASMRNALHDGGSVCFPALDPLLWSSRPVRNSSIYPPV